VCQLYDRWTHVWFPVILYLYIILHFLDFTVCLMKQGACVENVLDSVVVSLQKDPNRKFVFVEMVKRKMYHNIPFVVNWT